MDKHKLWQNAYHSEGSRHKNMWPSEGVISFILNENLNQNATVLDVGCGWLNNFRFCKSLGLNVYGVDIFISDDFKKAFAKVDAILTPTTPNTPFPIAHKIGDNPVQIYLNDVFTIPANLAGLPAISVPGGFDEKNLPIGVQLMANSFDEQTLFDIALALEKDK